jgi:phosphatidylinositol alpha-1,6-mannosyltransferase
MKILLLAQVFPPQTGGSGRWLWELYRRLEGIDVRVVAASTAGDAGFDGASPLAISRLPWGFRSWGLAAPRNAAQYWRTYAHVAAETERFGPDVLHCGKCLPEGLIALALKVRRGIPYYCYAHGEELTLAATSRELRWLTGRVLASADRIIANSTFTRATLEKDWRVPARKVVVMHPGADVDTFRPAPFDAAVRERLGWTGKRVVLTVGALQQRKGQDMMIRALPRIRRDCPDVLYAIAGEGWERSRLEQLVDDVGVRDAVQFRGTPGDEELLACYQQCDLFALPNRRIGWDVEGFGMVLVEAQACGRAVLAGRSGGTVDTLIPGVTGELVDASSAEVLAEAVMKMLNAPDRLQDMGRRAREWVVSQFAWNELTQQACRVFELTGGGVRQAEAVQPA